ncbi:Arc family DNA-binding protein [Burkholderia glumae]|uniref:Arc family DNA-binding protein n=1 Tax=Burkholderia glumae TaxID=337 RepID=UPI002150C4C7|nr:Arc family DNA-binding protein [Burkholderia glumae]UVS93466.1 Arc family DNA-binding protein [Burkholderia glumae]
MATKQPTAYPLRMPDEIRAKIEATAEEHGRSVNQEIVQRLADSFAHGGGLPKTITDVVEKAAANNRMTFDDALLKYIVIGMQAEPMRRALEERLNAERYRGTAVRHLMARCADVMAILAETLTSEEMTQEERGEWNQQLTMLVHEIRRMDRP